MNLKSPINAPLGLKMTQAQLFCLFFDNSTVEAFVHEERKFEISFVICFAFLHLLFLVVERNVDFSLYVLAVPVKHKYIDFIIKQASVL